MGKREHKIILLLLLAFILRLINLNQSFWLDEGAQMVMSQKPVLFQWIGRINDFHPPLYYLLMHFWLKLGRSEWFLRLPAVLSGVATVYFIYLIARKIINEKVAVLSALFLTFAPFQIYYSQEARMYSLFALLTTASMLFLWKKSGVFTSLSPRPCFTLTMPVFPSSLPRVFGSFFGRKNQRENGWKI